MLASSTGSTVTAVTNSTVSRKADELCPTLSVPGISSSAGAPRNLNSAGVGANEPMPSVSRSEEHTSELQAPCNLVCRLLPEKKELQPERTEVEADYHLVRAFDGLTHDRSSR